MRHKLIVFDWNGTILSDTLPAWKASNACLEFFNAEPISLKRYRETFNFPILHFYKLNGCSVDKVLERKDEANTLFYETYEAMVKTARTRTGARGLLEWITHHNMSCIILSNYQVAPIEAQLERLKIDRYFQHINANRDDGTSILHATSKAERLSAYMLKRNYKPEDTVIIGDSAEEPEIARHLGLTSIGITDGCISRARLKAANPDHIVHHLRDVTVILSEKWELPA